MTDNAVTLDVAWGKVGSFCTLRLFDRLKGDVGEVAEWGHLIFEPVFIG